MTNPHDPSLRTLAGRCNCGAVHYTVPDAFAYAGNCHCANCRRATGSAFKPFGGIQREHFRVTRGEDQLMRYGEPDGHDARCKVCGSLLYSIVREGAYVHVALGSLTDAPTVRPTSHIFVGSKAPWYTIGDDLPQHVGHEGAGEV